jgi:hypothetical protein
MSKRDIGTSKFFQKFGGITIACGDSSLKWQNISKSEMIRNGIDISAIENYSQAIDNPKLTIGCWSDYCS